MSQPFVDYFKCPEDHAEIGVSGPLSEDAGFFAFGPGAICYGQSSAGLRASCPSQTLSDLQADAKTDGSRIQLPFDLGQVVDNLRLERYAKAPGSGSAFDKLVRQAYYLLRPLMPVPVRKHFQRIRLKGWRDLPFPKWPVDTSVDALMQNTMTLAVKSSPEKKIPFIWFWPNGHSGCAIMTHDVETEAGVELCTKIMDMDESYGVPASFQVVPEKRYKVREQYLESLRKRDFEVNVQDLNHDGHLYSNWETFKRRAEKINRYAEQYRAVGFRAGVLYRNQEWYGQLHFEYDMSVPNAARLDPQRGGCCTVMPYFVGNMVELPVTATQDYSLFHILKEYSLELWKQQTALILQKNGLISFIVHPDYILNEQETKTFSDLLAYIARLRDEKDVWVAHPKEVSSWWKQRSKMKLVAQGDEWGIEGLGKERAVIAYASIENGRLVYRKVAKADRPKPPQASESDKVVSALLPH
jgi:hypothetical protein